jgi:hypothetical protein
MTYELGQQVLVWGVVAMHDAETDFYVIEASNGTSWFEAADVVGPTPATPDEGGAPMFPGPGVVWDLRAALTAAEAEIAKLRAENENVRFTAALTAERNADEITELRAALAAAEARIAAALELTWQTHWDHDETVDLVRAIRRALSVEAAGTEGGGRQ